MAQKVITPSKMQQPVSDAPSSVTVFTDTQLKLMGARTVADALRTVSGIYISVTERHLLRVHSRGIGNALSSYNDKILLMVDGTPQRDILYGHAFVDEYWSIDNIKRIEVIKGPGSALYGSNAYVGVINFITGRGSDRIKGKSGVAVEAGLTAGMHFTIAPELLVAFKFENDLTVQLSGRWYISDGDGGIGRPDPGGYFTGNREPYRVFTTEQEWFGTNKERALPRRCRECPYEFACFGECPKNRFIKTPDGEPGLNYLCSGWRHFYSQIDERVTEIARQIKATT